MDIYFKVSFTQCCKHIEINFPSLSDVKSFLMLFVYTDSICWIKDIQIRRCYISFNHDDEVLELESILYHKGI